MAPRASPSRLGAAAPRKGLSRSDSAAAAWLLLPRGLRGEQRWGKRGVWGDRSQLLRGQGPLGSGGGGQGGQQAAESRDGLNPLQQAHVSGRACSKVYFPFFPEFCLLPPNRQTATAVSAAC